MDPNAAIARNQGVIWRADRSFCATARGFARAQVWRPRGRTTRAAVHSGWQLAKFYREQFL